MRFQFPNGINSNFDGYGILMDFYNKTDGIELEDITLDFSNMSWFEANLTAVLGSILSKTQSNFNDIKIAGMSNKIETLFSRNHFLSHFGGLRTQDLNDTTIKHRKVQVNFSDTTIKHRKVQVNFSDTIIKYRKFKVNEEKLFKEYLDRELLSKEAMPKMSELLKKKINESIFEIFSNAVIHGKSQNIFTCGQYYPKKNRLDFTIVDLGRTIKMNVNDCLKDNLSGSDSIKWAVIEGNTTKQGSIPGGLGLSLIREFILKNQGKIQIVSADGYWEQIKATETINNFLQTFPGTVVNLEFNVADTNRYCLSSEIDKDDIF